MSCDWCGSPFLRRTLDHRRHSVGMSFCSRQHFQEWARVNFQREQNPAWKGSDPAYRGPAWRKARQLALARDSHRCFDCDSEDDLVVHHLTPFAAFGGSLAANELDNLVTLCRLCHLDRHQWNRKAS